MDTIWVIIWCVYYTVNSFIQLNNYGKDKRCVYAYMEFARSLFLAHFNFNSTISFLFVLF